MSQTTTTNAALNGLAFLTGQSIYALFDLYNNEIQGLCEDDVSFIGKAARFYGGMCCLKHTIVSHLFDFNLQERGQTSVSEIPSKEKFKELIKTPPNWQVDFLANYLAETVLDMLKCSAKRLMEITFDHDTIDWSFVEIATMHYLRTDFSVEHKFAYYFFSELLDYHAMRTGKTLRISKSGVDWIASPDQTLSFQQVGIAPGDRSLQEASRFELSNKTKCSIRERLDNEGEENVFSEEFEEEDDDILPQDEDDEAHLVVISQDDQGNEIRKRVDFLVANAFVPNPNNLKYVIHKDGDKTNCRADNLMWSSIPKEELRKRRN